MNMQKCVFLDRDGVLNEERGTYTFLLDDFRVLPDVRQALQILKDHGFLLIVVTNQSGIDQGLYSREMMHACHDKLNRETSGLIDEIYYAPGHPSVSESLSRKPGTLMLEKAIAKYCIDTSTSWMVGDRERDILCGHTMGLKTVLISNDMQDSQADFQSTNLLAAVRSYIQ